jgi:hypothetical protein
MSEANVFSLEDDMRLLARRCEDAALYDAVRAKHEEPAPPQPVWVPPVPLRVRFLRFFGVAA